MGGCTDNISNPCDPRPGDERSDLDDPGTMGLSGSQALAAVEGAAWTLRFAPSTAVDESSSFVTPLILHVQAIGAGDEFTVGGPSRSYTAFTNCVPGRHYRLPVALSVETAAGVFTDDSDDLQAEDPYIDALSLDPADLRVVGAVFPSANPFVNAEGGTCWPGNTNIADIELYTDAFFSAPQWGLNGDAGGTDDCAADWSGVPLAETSSTTQATGTP